jgi:hypothetical protein
MAQRTYKPKLMGQDAAQRQRRRNQEANAMRRLVAQRGAEFVAAKRVELLHAIRENRLAEYLAEHAPQED